MMANNMNTTPAMRIAVVKNEEKKASKSGYLSMAKALQMIASGASASDMVSSPVPVRKTMKIENEPIDKQHEAFANLPAVPLLLRGQYWTQFMTLIGGRPSEEALRQMFTGKRCFTPMEGILRDPMDPHFKKGGGKENICTVVHSTRHIRQAGDAFMRLAMCDETNYTPKEVQEAREWCEEAKHFITTNGPLVSCFQRLVHAVSENPKPTGRAYVEPDVIAAVKEMLPWKKNFVRDMKGRMADFEWLVLNLNSSSGFPWDQPKKNVLLQGYEASSQILNAIRDGSVKKLFDAHPQWLLVKLMNKLDRYDMRELKKALPKGAIRQYFVYPFHWVILFSALTQNISQCMTGFWEDPKSFSAHGFAWQDGGPQRIVDWIRASAKRGPGLYGIAYSDDQLWLIVCKDGSIIVLCPDINRMDLNLLTMVGRLYFEYGITVLEGNIDKTWEAVLRLQSKMAFDCAVIMEYAMVLQTMNFLHSGVPGTPEFDQVASAAGFHIMKKHVGEPDDMKDAKVRLETGFGIWMQKLGLSVKPYQMHDATPLLANPKEAYVTPWTFLGKHLMFEPRVNGWIPRSDPVRCVASILCPKSTQDGNSGIRAQMQRVRQIVASGGFALPQVYRAMASWYMTCRESLKLTPADPYEPADQELMDSAVDLELAVSFDGPNFPSYYECCNLYLPSDAKVNLSTMVPTLRGVGAVPQKGVVTASAMVSSLFEDFDEFEATGKWADARERPMATDGDSGATNIAALPTTTMDRTGRARPKTAAEEKEAKDRRRKLFLERMERLGYTARAAVKGGAPTAKKGRAMIGEKGRQFVANFINEHMIAADEPEAPKIQAEAYVGVEEELAGYDDDAQADAYYEDLNYEMEQQGVRAARALTTW